MKSRNRENALTHHLAALRDYMPAEHRALIGFDRVVTGKNIHWRRLSQACPTHSVMAVGIGRFGVQARVIEIPADCEVIQTL